MATTRGAAVVLHPHPGMGGDRTHPLVVAVADRLEAEGVAAVRPDIDDPDLETAATRLRSVAADLMDTSGARQLVLVGYSWGSAVSALVAPDELVGRVLVAPPVKMMEVAGDDGTPTLAVVPAHDQFGGPDAVRNGMGSRPGTDITVVADTDHFLGGTINDTTTRVVDWALAQLK